VLLGVRKTEAKANADCDHWMKEVLKAQAKAEKEHNKVPILVRPQVQKGYTGETPQASADKCKGECPQDTKCAEYCDGRGWCPYAEEDSD
jgi:hypothetical protein